MEFIPYDSFDEIQQQIVDMKLNNTRLTHNEWRKKIEEELGIKMLPISLVRFIKRTALGLPWEENSQGGRPPYLCPADIEELKKESEIRCREGTNYIELDEFLELALEIKVSRLLSASKFLQYIGSAKIASSLNTEEELEPSRQWINITAEKIGLVLEIPSDMQEERYAAGSKNLIKKFYNHHRDLIENCPKQLLFGADETMLKAVLKKKVLAESSHDALLRKNSDIPHITGMCCHNVRGAHPPPMIILPNSIQNVPIELQEFDSSGDAWFASSKSGWMTRDIFLVWCINFINWLSIYRKSLPASIRDARAVLITDGHGSRECPIGLEMLRRNNIDVLILPAHTTHITQMFDVGLAAPLKKMFGQTLNKFLKGIDLSGDDTTKIAKLRFAVIASFVTAWQSVCNYRMCRKAAEKTGWNPFDVDAAAASKYAEERTEEEDAQYLRKRVSRAGLDINSRVINTPEFIAVIAEKLQDHPHLKHLVAMPNESSTWTSICVQKCSKTLNNNCYFLSRIHPFVSRGHSLITFD